MTLSKRLLVLATLIAALVVPAVALGDGGGGTPPAPGARPAPAVRVLDRVAKRLDRRFQTFSKHCLVQSAPERCAKAADRLVTGLDTLQTGLQKVEATIKEKCGAADPPARCANAGQVTQAIDSLLSKIADDISAIKAAFPNAGP